jgi:XTP/dITP diphosphohydrolase
VAKKPLLIGSGNRDKAQELADLLAGLSWEVLSLADVEPVDEPEETGATFADNALLKARFYAERFGMACVADDSGLEVDHLDGAPGVYSARYAGDGCTYADNNRKLLAALEGVPSAQRTARFVCCAAFVADGIEHTEHGTCEGRITEENRGGNGFGYDPIFIPTGHTRTFGEMTVPEKQALSHRGHAFRQIRRYLETLG